MELWTVEYIDYDDYALLGVFENEEGAQDHYEWVCKQDPDRAEAYGVHSLKPGWKTGAWYALRGFLSDGTPVENVWFSRLDKIGVVVKDARLDDNLVLVSVSGASSKEEAIEIRDREWASRTASP